MEEVRNLLVIHQGALGDFILALPTLENLRGLHPQAKLTLLGYPRILELAEKRFYAEEISSIDQSGMATFFVHEGSLDIPLSRFFDQFDLIAVFGKDVKGALIRNLGRVCQGRILHINSFPPWDERIHLTSYLLRELSRYGYSISKSFPKIRLNESDRTWGNEFWHERGFTRVERTGAVVIHPGSGSRKKVWPVEHFQDVALYLRKRIGSPILVVLGPADGSGVQRILEGRDIGRKTVVFAKGLSLLQLAAVMEGCRLFIGNDSGITHLAAAVGLPTIAIFGPTDPKVWSPRGKKVIVIRKEIPCSPCPQERFFLCQHGECLKSIETEEVLAGVKRLGIPL
jgi:ADP-heptose:LPS heptosyltransferase